MKFINAALIILSVAVAPSASQEQRVRGQRNLQSKQSGFSNNAPKNKNKMGKMNKGNTMSGGMTMGMGGWNQEEFIETPCSESCGLMGIGMGVLVCRSSKTLCIEPNLGLLTDMCGCCGGVCPSPDECSTTCERADKEEGILVNKTKHDGEVISRCVTPLDAVSMLLRNNTACG